MYVRVYKPYDLNFYGVCGCGNAGENIDSIFMRLRGPNQWPPAACIPEFRSIAMEFMEQMNVFSMHLMQALALSLGLDQDFFDSTFLPHPHYQMKVWFIQTIRILFKNYCLFCSILF